MTSAVQHIHSYGAYIPSTSSASKGAPSGLGKVTSSDGMRAELASRNPFRVTADDDTDNPLFNVRKQVSERVLSYIYRENAPLFFRQQAQAIFARIVHNQRYFKQHHDVTPLLRRFALKLSHGDKGFELAMLYALLSVAQDESKTYGLGYYEDIIEQFINENDRALKAYLNISSVLEEFKELGSKQELVGHYTNIMVTTHSTLSALTACVKRFGAENIKQWAPFLTKCAVADLLGQQVGADKVHLMYVLSELKSFRTLNTLLSFLNKLKDNRLKHIPIEETLMTSLEYVEQPIATMPSIEKWVSACVHSEQILFFQDYRNIFSRLSLDAFKDEEQQQNAKTVLQKRIDQLVYSE